MVVYSELSPLEANTLLELICTIDKYKNMFFNCIHFVRHVVMFLRENYISIVYLYSQHCMCYNNTSMHLFIWRLHDTENLCTIIISLCIDIFIVDTSSLVHKCSYADIASSLGVYY